MPNEKPDSFQCGAFEVSRNPDVRQFVEKLNRLREAVDACRVQPGVGYTVSRSSGGTTLSIKAGGGGGSVPADPYPYQVEWFKENDVYAFRIEEQSYLLPSRSPIAQAGETISTGIRQLSQDVLIYLRVAVNVNFEGENPVTSTELVAKLQSEYLYPVEPFSGARQTHANVILATVSQQGRLVQNVRTHLQLAWSNWAGYSALSVVPSP